MDKIISVLENLTKSKRRMLAIATYGGFLWFCMDLGDSLTWVTDLISIKLKIETTPSHGRTFIYYLSLFISPYFLPSFISSRSERFKSLISVLEDLIAAKIDTKSYTFEGDCTATAKFIACVAKLQIQLSKWKIWTPKLTITENGALFQEDCKRWKLYCAKLIKFASDGKVKKAASWACPEAMKSLTRDVHSISDHTVSEHLHNVDTTSGTDGSEDSPLVVYKNQVGTDGTCKNRKDRVSDG